MVKSRGPWWHKLIVLLVLGAVLSPPRAAAAPSAQPAAAAALAAALQLAGARIAYHAHTGQARFVGLDPDRPLSQATLRAQAAMTLATPTARPAAARNFLAVYGPLFGLSDAEAELRVRREQTLGDGRSYVRFQQMHQGVPVLGGELIVQMDKGYAVLSASGEVLPDLTVDTRPRVPAEAARETALLAAAKHHRLSPETLAASTPELWVYNPALLGPRAAESRLAWRVEVAARDGGPVRELVLVDAHRGGVVLQFNQVPEALHRVTYTAGNSGSLSALPGIEVCREESDPECLAGDEHARAAHRHAADTYNFFHQFHGRDGVDGLGMSIKSTVHFGSGYDNAFWNGSQVVYGDAYGFPLADDVVAHELTHGVTQYESELFYYYQSGAINESLSDIWGEFVDLTNGTGNDSPEVRWLIGEDISGAGAFRSLKDPGLYGDPDRMRSHLYVTDAFDAGGVHTNSGVGNKAAYLMVDGGNFNGYSISPLGLTKTATIYYTVQTELLTSGADYADLYDALYQACLVNLGVNGLTAADCQEVREATLAVEMNEQPEPGYNPEAPLCPAGRFPLAWFLDDLESGTARWTFTADQGTVRWQYDSPYGRFAHSGRHFLYADDYVLGALDDPEYTDTSAAMASGVMVPASGTPYLRFAHAFGFEDDPDGYYDGGVVEYSANGGPWLDAGDLFDANGYRGTLSTGYGNPLGGRQAFVGDSHGYISSRLDLTPLAGQSVRFRWRMGLDASRYDYGWWLDDVMVYTCVEPSLFLPLVRR